MTRKPWDVGIEDSVGTSGGMAPGKKIGIDISEGKSANCRDLDSRAGTDVVRDRVRAAACIRAWTRRVVRGVYCAPLRVGIQIRYSAWSNPLDEVVNEVKDREQGIMETKGRWPSRSGDQM